jgi:Zn-dependent protease with chaperone function
VEAKGRYFPPRTARSIGASLTLSADGKLRVTGPEDNWLNSAQRDEVQASSRLGRLLRKVEFPDGGCFETEDNDAIDAMLRPRDHLLHRLEKSWRAVLASVGLALAAAALFAFYGVPWTAGWLARHTPDSIARIATSQTLTALDGRILKPSKLSKPVQAQTQDIFRQVAKASPRGEKGYRLLLRDSSLIGPNAFALPDGTIVATDQIVTLSKKPDELRGLFGHEASHVDHAHGLQSVYQASLVPAAIAFITGDVTQAGQIAVILPGILLQSAYSREFEQQADDDARALMRRMGRHPDALGDLLTRIEARICGKKGCGASWLGSHPDTAARAARLREQ